MRKAFVIEPSTEFNYQYFRHKRTYQRMDEEFLAFAKKNLIESREYVRNAKKLIITPTLRDIQRFNKQMEKYKAGYFSIRSKIGYDWKNLMDSKNIVDVEYPSVPQAFGLINAKCKSRLFDVDGVLYATLECADRDLTIPPGFQEIDYDDLVKDLESRGIYFEE